ncbi:MAG TPA: 3-phosphoserine/phosphohydroxythreonine transaminase [Saprospiraceae bacterium]|nr:3-phosphoserine/phosphohydroxythreonine transaminase [Saprospiraceae bacterium]
MKKINFSAGPAILPQSVIEKAAQAILDYNGSGLSLIEVSHRGKDFIETMDQAISLTKELLGIGDEFEVLFLQGGASMQFYQVPLNLINDGETAGYINTGTWSKKAIKEAKLVGNVKVLASSEESNFSYIPKGFEIPSDLKYLHYTSNNTIFGTQFHNIPLTDVKLVSDMSSDMFSRPIDIEKYDLIYAGAQKNIGPAGVTLVIVRKEALSKINKTLPSMLDYRIHAENVSMFNTPPVFAVYTTMLTLQWIKDNGGLSAMSSHNEAKSKVLYDVLDESSLFVGHAAKEDRSHMNVTFNIANPDLEGAFSAACKAAGLDGLKGHRSVGGFRASIYNAMQIEGIQILADIMTSFEKKNS